MFSHQVMCLLQRPLFKRGTADCVRRRVPVSTLTMSRSPQEVSLHAPPPHHAVYRVTKLSFRVIGFSFDYITLTSRTSLAARTGTPCLQTSKKQHPLAPRNDGMHTHTQTHIPPRTRLAVKWKNLRAPLTKKARLPWYDNLSKVVVTNVILVEYGLKATLELPLRSLYYAEDDSNLTMGLG